MIKKIKTVFQFNVKQCVLLPRKRNFAVGECPMIFVELCWQRENIMSIYKVSLTRFNGYKDVLVVCTS